MSVRTDDPHMEIVDVEAKSDLVVRDIGLHAFLEVAVGIPPTDVSAR